MTELERLMYGLSKSGLTYRDVAANGGPSIPTLSRWASGQVEAKPELVKQANDALTMCIRAKIKELMGLLDNPEARAMISELQKLISPKEKEIQDGETSL